MAANRRFLQWLLPGCLLCAMPAAAQEQKPVPIIPKQLTSQLPPHNTDTVDERDVTDVIAMLRKKPVQKERIDIGPKPSFTVVPAIGYTLQSKLVGSVTANAVFHYPDANISTVSAVAGYSQLRQLTIPVESNIWIRKNKLNLVGDFRFYKYPQSTFGLGSGSPVRNENPMSYSFFRFYEIVLTPVGKDLYAGIGYIFDHRWNITEKGLPDGRRSDYSLYGPSDYSISAGLTLNSVYERRDNPINPSSGSYVNLQFRNSFGAFGSTANWQSAIIDVRKYVRFPGRSRNVLAFWSYNWLIVKGTPPYLDLPSNAWDSYSNTGRGYIQGRFRGAQMADAEVEYRYGITANGLFGGVVFANAMSFSAAQGSRLQAVQPGAGAGLRIKLNKVSKTNVAIDYAFGTQRSHGLFVSIGEAF